MSDIDHFIIFHSYYNDSWLIKADDGQDISLGLINKNQIIPSNMPGNDVYYKTYREAVGRLKSLYKVRENKKYRGTSTKFNIIKSTKEKSGVQILH